MYRRTALYLICLVSCAAMAQPPASRDLHITVVSGQSALPHATVSLLGKDSALIRTATTDQSGVVIFNDLAAGYYMAKISLAEYQLYLSSLLDLESRTHIAETFSLKRQEGVLSDVTVVAKKPFVQYLPDKTVINVDAGITNAGISVMEVLEKSPGITIDRDGNISLKGRPAVQIMIDGKLTQLGGTDLQNYLTGLNASQVDVIELIDNPGAKYDAAGNAGIINIRTKKNKQKGFNGSVTSSSGQGKYTKFNNSIILNYRTGDLNFFVNYTPNFNKNFYELFALRTYYKTDGSAGSLMQQDAFTKSTFKFHNVKAGVDYFVDKKTTVGVVFKGIYIDRVSEGESPATWSTSGTIDSIIQTNSRNTSILKQGGINFNARHVISASRELSADIEWVGYNIIGRQYFENRLLAPGSQPEASQGDIPTDITIFSARADYSHQFKKVLWEAGLKSAHVSTDNLAQYFYYDNNHWQEDLGKSNHFLYDENIHAAYSSLNAKTGKWELQGGLRYEFTSYKATQLGNAVNKDSSFNRRYHSLFPTAFITWHADSANSFTLRAGRRIDRPVYQKLNPFLFIINKYTFQQGNPFFRPQFTWNIELGHVYKQILSTSISYNYTKDYFSQIFTSDPTTGIIIYSEGNVGRMQNIGATISAQLSPAKWWSLSTQATYNYKLIEGVLWKPYKATINQLNLSMNNQFRFGKGWGAELSGFYITRNQNDLQEVLDPTGQVSAGISKQVLKNKGSIRLTCRDIFYTQAMQGWTYFQTVIEYFKLIRDTRVATISFTYRFGKAMKQPARSAGGASDEINRVNVN